MKYHRTEGRITAKTKEEVARKLARLLDTNIHHRQ